MRHKTVISVSFLLLWSLLLSTNSNPAFSHSNQLHFEPKPGKVKAWLKAVRANRNKKAIKIASEIVSRNSLPSPSEYVLQLAKLNGMDSGFLKSGFNKADAQYWKHKVFYHDKAKEIAEGNKTDQAKVRAVYDAVRNRVGDGSLPYDVRAWPYNVWKEKTRVCDRKAWLVGEFLYQLGFNYSVVYFWDKDQSTSPHTVLEVRKGSETWVVDAHKDIFLENTSMDQIARSEKQLPKKWQQYVSKNHGAPHNPKFWIAAYPQDYSARNQLLGIHVRTILKRQAPSFAESPIKRMKQYRKLPGTSDQEFPYDLWPFPFKLLAATHPQYETGS